MIKLFSICLLFLLATFGYLQPFHSLPWISAINEGAFLAFGLLFILFKLIDCKARKIGFTRFEVVLLILVILHELINYDSAFHRDIVPIILIFGVCYICGKLVSCESYVLDVLLVSIFFSAIISSIFGIGLWLGAAQQFDTYQVWMTNAKAGGVLVSSLAQPNNAGTLLVWGLAISAMYMYKISGELSLENIYLRQIFSGIIFSSAILMSCGIVLTQSRTVLINLMMLLLASIIYRRYIGGRVLKFLIFCCVVVLLGTLCLPSIKVMLFDSLVEPALGGKGFYDGVRIKAYSIFFEALKDKWLSGFGLVGVTQAFMLYVDGHSNLNVFFGHVHNLPLEILLCLGVPLGSLVLFTLLVLLKRALVGISTVKEALYLYLVLTVLIHSMLEYPLHYVYFLLPTVMFLAVLQPKLSVHSFSMPRYLMFSFWFVLLLLFISLAVNYFAVEQDLRQARLQVGLLGKAVPVEKNYTNNIKELEALNIVLRAEVNSNISNREFDAYEFLVWVFPTKKIIENYIFLLRIKGRQADANYWDAKKMAVYGN